MNKDSAHSMVQIIPAQASDLKDLYLKYKAALFTIIEDTFGWDEKFQYERFEKTYELNWFHWIKVDDELVGYICYWKTAAEIHVSLLILNPEMRGFGFGRQIMKHVHNEARKNNCKLTLSSFRKNVAAIKFYESLGYITSVSDENFVDLKLENP
jgi:GNAT superfamily N-acetyltransferase